MSTVVFNVSLGRVIELYNRVKSNDPSTSALILIPVEAAGLESDDTLADKDTVADVFSGSTSRGTLLTAHATLAHTMGSYVELFSSTTATSTYVLIQIQGGSGSTYAHQFMVDIGVGASGSEVVKIPTLLFARSLTADNPY